MVTAVITTHMRSPEIVERALKSVISQTYDDIEIIVVDDSPTDYVLRDKVRSMVESYIDCGVKYIAHEKRAGACAARNTGLMEAKGEYIAYLDDDDEWLPEKLEKQIKRFSSDRVALVYCGRMMKNDLTGHMYEHMIQWYSGRVYDRLILKNFIGSTSFPMIRADALRAVCGFDVLMQSSQDYDVWLRLAREYEVDYVEEPLVIYHIHEGEQITKNYEKQINGTERLIEKNAAYLKTNRDALWDKKIALTQMYALNKQAKKAMQTWLNAVHLGPKNVLQNIMCFARVIKYTINQIYAGK